MGALRAMRTCLGKYATFSGRAGRGEFWWFALFVGAGWLVAARIDATILSPLWQVAMALPLLAAGWRRMHDAGRFGKLLVLPVLLAWGTLALLDAGLADLGSSGGSAPHATILGSALLIVISIVQLAVTMLLTWWLTRPSDPGANRYGPPPPA